MPHLPRISPASPPHLTCISVVSRQARIFAGDEAAASPEGGAAEAIAHELAGARLSAAAATAAADAPGACCSASHALQQRQPQLQHAPPPGHAAVADDADDSADDEPPPPPPPDDDDPRPWYYLDAAHAQQGPVGWTTLCEWAAEGRIDQSTYLFTEGMADWVFAGEYGLGLAPS